MKGSSFSNMTDWNDWIILFIIITGISQQCTNLQLYALGGICVNLALHSQSSALYNIHFQIYNLNDVLFFICRPIFGFTNICVNRALSDGIMNLRSILIHEITHALVS